MQTIFARALVTASVLVLGSTVLASAATATSVEKTVAQASPAPKTAPTPNPFSYNGYVRAFYFTRQNASAYPKGTGQLNQAAFNAAIKLHGEYHFGSSPWIVGATYVGANPFGYNAYCDDVANYGAGGTCQQYPTSNNNFKMSDTTLPGYSLSTFGEAYVQYKDKYLNAKVGTQQFTSPWANPSDSRVKPVFFEGVDANYTVAPGWTIGASRMIQWESRVSSDFNKSNLLPGSLNTNGTIKNPTTGFLLGKASYVHGSDFAGNINFYDFYDVSTLLWLDGKWYPWPKSPMKFFIGGQFASQNSVGRAIAGTINNQTIGAQIGASAGKNVDVTLGFDTSPWRSMDISAATCSAAQTASGLFLPAGGTPTCINVSPGMYRVFYGGVASPYTDSYATDPLYTTSISQGMADRRSAGDSFKLAATYHTTDNKFKFAVSRASYNYSNGAGGGATTYETNLDLTYFFNKVAKGPYHGFQIRHRYAERTINNTIQFGGLPLFKYNRTQLEYDF